MAFYWSRDQAEALRAMDFRCGTEEGYRQHYREGSLPCGECFYAHVTGSNSSPGQRNSCGSNDGWKLHRRNGESPCESCAVAREHYVDGTHGTYKGWMLHRHMGTPVCEGCRLARNRYQSSQRMRKRTQR